jgi:hypothetical protein
MVLVRPEETPTMTTFTCWYEGAWSETIEADSPEAAAALFAGPPGDPAYPGASVNVRCPDGTEQQITPSSTDDDETVEATDGVARTWADWCDEADAAGVPGNYGARRAAWRAGISPADEAVGE